MVNVYILCEGQTEEQFVKQVLSPSVSRIQAIRTAYPSPEFIDDSPDTAPSKRIKSLILRIKKLRIGIVLAERIGIDRILQECPHFRAWVGKIRALAG